MPDFRIIPSIEQLRQRPAVAALERDHGSPATLAALRAGAAALRRMLAADDAAQTLPGDAERAAEHIEAQATRQLARTFEGSLGPVINATGVVIHTNLGRAPLAEPALDRLRRVAAGYSNLEYDVARGERGSRAVHAERLLAQLTGADAAAVVNNNAAATLLLLAALASGREVVVSRGELVEVGGGFRVPDVMAQSGAVLREVGTTNRTRVADYRAAIGPRTAMLLRVHPSNFRIEGFTERPALRALVAAAGEAGVPLVEDLGSGCLIDGLAAEPTVQASVAAGVDLVCFSGDKLLGGPQAGIIVGSHALIARVVRHPLMRALRVDKLTLAALEGTLLEYVAGRAAETVPVIRMVCEPAAAVEHRARTLADRLRAAGWVADVRPGASAIGGGSAPGVALDTALLSVERPGVSAAALEAQLRERTPPIIVRIEHDRVVLDLRTVAPDDDEHLAEALLETADP